ncbi:MAG: SMP-30/gluconolactonase/LRE family protein [Myxococcota bacterium]
MALLTLLACAPKVVAPDLGGPPPGPFWPASPEVPHVAYVGEVRPPTGVFARPIDVACGAGHVVAVADVDAGAVWVLDLSKRRGFADVATPDGRLWAPVGVAFDGGGRLYVADADRATVLRGRDDRRALLAAVTPEGQLGRPTAVLPRTDGSLVVVDAGAHALVRVTPAGEVEPVAAARGAAGAGFNFPVDVAIGPAGEHYVADAMNATVDRVGPDGRVEVFTAGSPVGSIVRPKGVAVDARGNVHVVDGAMQHVEVYDASARLLGRYGEPGSGPGQLGLPAGICIDADDHVFVADTLNGRVQVFRLLEAP